MALCNTVLRVCDEVVRSNHWFETATSTVESVALARACAHLLGQTSLMVLADPQQWPLHNSIATSGRTSGPGSRRIRAALGSSSREEDYCGSRSKRAVFLVTLVEAGSETSSSSPWRGEACMGFCKHLSLLGQGTRVLLGTG